MTIRSLLPPAAGLICALLLAGQAMAQNVRPEVALSTSSYGSMTCRNYLAMSPGERDSVVRKMNFSAPPSTLATQVFSPDIPSGEEVTAPPDRTNEPPLDSGILVSACQGNPSTSTLRAAYAHSNTLDVPPDSYN